MAYCTGVPLEISVSGRGSLSIRRQHRKEPSVRHLIATLWSLALCVCALTATGVYAQSKNPLAGAWRVAEIENPGGKPNTNPQPGLYLFNEKHYSAVRLNGSKPLPSYPSNDVATDADKVAVFDILYMNTGTYSVSGNLL